ncbi:MAG: NUDIX hydrolase [Acidobacteriota bacterium]
MEYSFCPKCGGRLALKTVKMREPQRLVCMECSFIFFLDPKVAACTLFTVDGNIVLLKRGIEPSYGMWVFPGGYVDRGETVEEAAIRETREEVNLDVEILHCLNVYSYSDSPVIIVVYAARVLGGHLAANDETLAVQGFAPAEIPWSELAFPSTEQALRDYLSRYFPK